MQILHKIPKDENLDRDRLFWIRCKSWWLTSLVVWVRLLTDLGKDNLNQFCVKCPVLSWAEKVVKHGVKDFGEKSLELIFSNTLEK